MDSAVTHSLLVARPTKLSRFVVFSVGAHIAVLVAGILYARLTSTPKMDLDQKPINASLVRLGKPRDPKLLPRKEQAQPPPKEVAAKPVPTPPSQEPVPAPSPNAVAVPGAKPAPAPTPQKGEANAEDRRKKLFGAFDKSAKPSEPEELEGAEDGDPDGDSAVQEGERYYGLLKSQVRRHYNVADTIPDAERLYLKAQVAMRLGRSGEVLDVSLAKASGNELFDSAVVAAVRKASPFSPPPDALRDALQKNGVVLVFSP